MTVRRSAWKLKPMTTSSPLPYHRYLSPHELNCLVQDHGSSSMDDKWLIFTEDDTVHFHRSWTGEEIYAVSLNRHVDGSAEIAEVRANDAYRRSAPWSQLDDAGRIEILDRLVERIVST